MQRVSSHLCIHSCWENVATTTVTALTTAVSGSSTVQQCGLRGLDPILCARGSICITELSCPDFRLQPPSSL